MKTPIQLSRWQFIGLAMSAFWMLGVTFYQRQIEFPKAQDYAMTQYFICTERITESGARDMNPCLDNVSNDWDKWMQRKWRDIAMIALLPIAAGWLIGFVWMRIYAKTSQKWPSGL
jgi:hypothetical protein